MMSEKKCCKNALITFGEMDMCLEHLFQEHESLLSKRGIKCELTEEWLVFYIPTVIRNSRGVDFHFEDSRLFLKGNGDFFIQGDPAHPHVFDARGEIYLEMHLYLRIKSFLEAGDLLGFYAQALDVVSSYNPKNSYRHLWDEEYFFECDACGKTFSKSLLAVCDKCNTIVCKYCITKRGCKACTV